MTFSFSGDDKAAECEHCRGESARVPPIPAPGTICKLGVKCVSQLSPHLQD